LAAEFAITDQAACDESHYETNDVKIVDEEIIQICDPLILMKGLNSYYEYFVNTGCLDLVPKLDAIKDRLQKHLNFE
jgi:hypothetical protein